MIRMNRKGTSNLVLSQLRLWEICSQNRGNSVSGDLKCKNFLGGCPKTPKKGLAPAVNNDNNHCPAT